MTNILNALATFVLTYGVHSAVACALALVLGRVLRRPHERDLVWKAALVLPIITSTLLILTDADSSMRVDLGRLARQADVITLPGRRVTVHVFQEGARRTVLRKMDDPVAAALSTTAVAVTAFVVLIALGRLGRRRLALSRALRGRQYLDTRIGDNIALSVADELPSPVALSRAEICLPSAVVEEFDGRHRDSLVAHELAHVRRNDPAWFAFIELISALSAFQPLVSVVARAFRRDVELICDEAAVHHTRDPQALIGALALLASPFDARAPLHGVATAWDGSSPLVARATRIATLGDSATARRPIVLLVAAALLVSLVALPVVSAAPSMNRIEATMHKRTLVRADRHILDADSTVIVLRSRERQSQPPAMKTRILRGPVESIRVLIN